MWICSCPRTLSHLNALALLSSQLTINRKVYFQTLILIPLIYTSILCQYQTILMTVSLCRMFWNWELRVLQLSSSFFKIVLALLAPLHFHRNFRIILSISTRKKESGGVVIWVAFNLQIPLGRIAILTISSLPSHEYGTPFHLFRPSLNSLKNVL